MANQFYGKAREAFSSGLIDWVNDTVKVVLGRTSGYTVSINTHDFLDDIPSGARVATATLASKTNLLGVLDAADAVFTSVPAGAACDFMAIYKDTGTEGTSRLIVYVDTYAGLPITPNGGNINLALDNGGNRIGVL